MRGAEELGECDVGHPGELPPGADSELKSKGFIEIK